MGVIKIEVNGNIARATERPGRITAGTVGQKIEFRFDEEWNGLNKIAVFRGGTVAKDRQIIDGEQMTVPHEVMAVPCDRLVVGVEGRNADGTIVIPTTYANICTVIGGADASGDPAIEEPPTNIYDDIMAAIDAGKMRGPKGDSYVRDITTGKLTDREKVEFDKLVGSEFLESDLFVKSNNLPGFSAWAYANVGVNVSGYLLSVHNTFTKMFNSNKNAAGYRYEKLEETEENRSYFAMLLPGSYGGGKAMTAHGYFYTLTADDYKVGDIFCMRYETYFDDKYADSCYYMALCIAKNTFLLYQDFGAWEDATHPSNTRIISYSELENIMNSTTSIYFYVMRLENIAVMDLMDLEERQNALEEKQASDTNALNDRIENAEKKQADDVAVLNGRIDGITDRHRDLNVGKLTTIEMDAIAGLTEGKPGTQLTRMAKWAYGQAGIDVSTYFTGETISTVLQIINGKKEGNPYYSVMLVPNSKGQPLSMDAFQIGDIFCGQFTANGENAYWAAVYQGNNQFIKNEGGNGSAEVVSFGEGETIYNSMVWNYYYVLRPENIAIADAINKVPVGMVTRHIRVAEGTDSLDAQINAIFASMADCSSEMAELSQTTSTDIGTGSNWMLMITRTNSNYGAIIAWQYGYPVAIKTRGRVAGSWGGWNQITVTSGDIITSTNWPQYINVSGGGSTASGMLEEFEATQTTGTNNNKIVKSGNTYTFTTLGNLSKLYNLTVRCIGINGSTDPDDLSSHGYFNSLTVGWKQVVAACTDPSIGEYYMAVPCFNPSGAFEGVAISASYNSSTGRITFQLTSKTWELYHIRGLY